MTENMKLKVQTAFGILVAYSMNDPDFPGIAIDLINVNGAYISLAVVEVNQMDEDEPVLQMHRWERDVQEDPVDQVYLDAAKVEKMLNWAEEEED